MVSTVTTEFGEMRYGEVNLIKLCGKARACLNACTNKYKSDQIAEIEDDLKGLTSYFIRYNGCTI